MDASGDFYPFVVPAMRAVHSGSRSRRGWAHVDPSKAGLVAESLAESNIHPLVFMALVNLLFLVLGCLFDATTLLLIVVPLFIPTAKALHIDLVYFGVVLTVNIMIGLVTPPYGVLLFVINGVTGIPLRCAKFSSAAS